MVSTTTDDSSSNIQTTHTLTSLSHLFCQHAELVIVSNQESNILETMSKTSTQEEVCLNANKAVEEIATLGKFIVLCYLIYVIWVCIPDSFIHSSCRSGYNLIIRR